MKSYTEEQIEEKVKELWIDEFYYDKERTMKKVQPPDIDVDVRKSSVRIKISAMYEAPGLSFSQLKALSEFFETENINDAERFHHGGCETCDYGSSYGFELEIS